MLAKTGLAVVLALCASSAGTALARPTSQQPRRTPSAPRSHGNFGPSLDHRFYEHGVDSDFPTVSFLTAPVAEDPANIALKYVSSKTNVPTADLRVSSHHTSKHNGVTHVYIQQYRDALEVSNGVANVNIDQNGRVISWGSSLFTEDGRMVHQVKMTDNARVIKHVDTASNKMDLGPADAVLALAKFLNLEINVDLEAIPVDHFTPGEDHTPSFIVGGSPFAVRDIPAKLKYIQDGQRLLLVWDLEVEMKDNWYNAFVNTETGEVVQLLDWVSDAAYNIFPLGTNDPVSGERVLVTDPAHHLASPLGWHDQGAGRQHTVTIGNNVYAHENLEGRSHWLDNYRPEGTKTLTFDFPVDLEKQPSTYLDAAITNLFYWNNAIHDLLYVYGFDEEAGNFQHDNFGRGGRGGDAVIANAQDGSGYNNANFATPRDGQQPRMRMYVWDVTSPYRDGDLEGGIIMHEYCHGLSIRLTGGPMNVGCLGWGESGGMGEGWGDFFATVTRVTANTTRHQDYGMGDYANGGSGIRKYKYSTDKSVNPSTYKFISQPGYWGVHAKGEVWAEILYEVFWELVDKHGFDPDWFNTGYEGREPSSSYREFRTGQLQPRDHMSMRKTKGGNIVALQLVVDGMKLQPCYPTFVEARDAIMQADKLNNNGENLCALWKAFAKRGLGADAKSGGTESFVVPKKCRSKN
ncbi:Fungalysin/Thermolysin Extracellular metalloproteinase 5 [Gaertneriomyces sp. JEL0708]|nr:Fungalysin/Thermolysin Extracellular metalloproteinase 5 [Gaertneriomyces sp. JEL0708]